MITLFGQSFAWNAPEVLLLGGSAGLLVVLLLLTLRAAGRSARSTRGRHSGDADDDPASRRGARPAVGVRGPRHSLHRGMSGRVGNGSLPERRLTLHASRMGHRLLGLWRAVSRLTRAAIPDALTLAGLVLISVGAALAWAPIGFVVAGASCLWVVRYGTEAAPHGDVRTGR